MRCFVASINEECINKWGVLLLPSTKSASINEVFCCVHQLRGCTLCWWRQQNTSFIDALFIEGGNTSPHLLMHSSLMEATKHLIYWCTLCWWKQQNTSFIDALFVDGSNKTPHLLMHSSLMKATKHLIYWCTQMRCFVASINDECINKWGVLLLPSTKSASINEVFCCLHQQRVHQ
jgi:hypothetical protein